MNNESDTESIDLIRFKSFLYRYAVEDMVQTELGGRLDGKVRHGLAYTVPIGTGFQMIEALFNDFAARTPEAIWEYGNVYAENGEPIGWWLSET